MDTTTIATIVSAVAIIIAGYAIWKAHSAGTPISAELVQSTLATATTTAQELTEVAITAAQASEQLWRDGKIQKSDRLNRAFDYVRKWFPDMDQATIITALESAVLVVNSITAALPNKANKGN